MGCSLRLTWPLPALLVWALGWALFVLLRSAGMPPA
ncbi:MAG: class I SAM-dependent methyltransferase, partial [Rhizobiales bacterium]|nr:class I SAM-dependent methyltransferase [Rhizobacter sp.]